MKKYLLILIIVLLVLVITAGIVIMLKNNSNFSPGTADNSDESINVPQNNISNASNMKLESSAFTNEGELPNRYTCDGANINPHLQISEVPQSAQSLVITLVDPDAPSGLWVHWTVWNIDPKTVEIKENSVPLNAIEGITSFEKSGYGGACPPSGEHRYIFHLYALDNVLTLTGEAKYDILMKALEGHILAQTALISRYSRK